MKKAATQIVCFIALLVLFATTVLAQAPMGNEAKLFRFPALSPDGNRIAFSYQGDIWIVNANGGEARRLTIHESYESNPQWSPDGSQILFQGNRHGNNDLFTMKANGGNLQRKTYNSTSDYSAKWGPEGSIWFNTRRNYVQVERESEIYRLDPQYATPYRALGSLGMKPAPHNDGRLVAFEKGHCRTEREAYDGPANRNIWVYDQREDEYRQITADDAQEYMADWGEAGRLYFLSAGSGKYNIYSVEIAEDGTAEGQAEAVTNDGDWGIRYYDVNKNGDIVYTKGSAIFLKRKGEEAQEIAIDVVEDFRFYPEEKESFSSGMDDYALSPDEKLIAFVVRGEVFVMQNDKDKSRAVRLSDHPWRDVDVEWLNDETLLFLSDRNGHYDLYKLTSADEGQPNIFKSLKHKIERVTDSPEGEQDYSLSNDRDRIAIIRNDALIVADIDSAANISNDQRLIEGWDAPSGIQWSPDDRWLAYSQSDLDFNSEVFILSVEGGDPVNVSMHPRRDYGPYWSQDGSKLGFLSQRNNADYDLWFAWLTVEDWEKTSYDWEEDDEEDEKSEKKEEKEEDEESEEEVAEDTMEIDLDNIHRRLLQVTREPGNEGDLLISEDGETFYYTTHNGGWTGGGGEPEFKSIKWDGSDGETVLSNGRIYGLNWDESGKSIYYLKSGGRLSVLNVSNKKSENLPFQASMVIDHPEERKQVFEEAWRVINERFYDPGFHGRDWAALKEKYRPVAMAASTDQDFRDIFNEMLGQINASHMGLYGSNPEETQPDRTGRLGLSVKPVDDGLEIIRIVRHSPADRTDVELAVGEIISGVNGEPVTPQVNFYDLLDETRNEKIFLTVKGSTGEEREVILRPTSSLSRELYDEWVQERRELTERYSNGRLGYIHIQGMNWTSFETFERELTASGQGKDGIIIDVRWNGGGWTTDMLMAILNARQHAYTIPRGATGDLDNHKQFRSYYPYGERLPFPYIKVPTVALCNEASYSNAEIFSHAYKTLDHGTLVGMPTFGAVISTGGQGLLDGSFIRVPFRGWFVLESDANMDFQPAVPDVLVEYPPEVKEQMEDPQLEKAVEVLLDQID